MLIVRKLFWDTWNLAHIARPNVSPEEIEAACHNNPLVLQGKKKGRLVLVSKSDEQRMIKIVLETKGNGKFYPVTAYDVDRQDTAFYNRLRGGDNNEPNKK